MVLDAMEKPEWGTGVCNEDNRPPPPSPPHLKLKPYWPLQKLAKTFFYCISKFEIDMDIHRDLPSYGCK